MKKQSDTITVCPKCKYEIENHFHFCPNCGKKITVNPQKPRKRGNGEGTAYKRGSVWMAVWVSGWRLDADGNAHPIRRTKSGFATKREALEYIPKLKEARSKNPDENITFLETFNRFSTIHAQRVGASTMTCYKSAMKHFTDIHLMKLKDVGVDDLQDCVDHCPNGKRTKQNMKAIAGLLFKYGMSRGIVQTNLSQFLYIGNDTQTTRPPFSLRELSTITEAAKNGDSDAEIIAIMCYTGFRPNELLSLEKAAVHDAGSFYYFVGGFKTDAGRDRIVPISPKILPYVLKRLNGSVQYLFPIPNGTAPMNDDYFRENSFYPCLDRLGIQPAPDAEHPARLVPYSCRHTFANLLKNVKGSDTDKAALMGHTDASMTKYYQSAELEAVESIVLSI